MNKQYIPIVVGLIILSAYMLWDMFLGLTKKQTKPPMEKLFKKFISPMEEEIMDKVAKDMTEERMKDKDEETIDRFTAAYLNDLILRKQKDKN